MILRPPAPPRPRIDWLDVLLNCPPPPPLQLLPPTPPRPTADPIPYVQALYHLLPRERLDYILRQTRRTSRRHRRLRADAVTWLVIAMSLFPEPSIPKVWRQLHSSAAPAEPSDTAFSQARRRLGVAPLRLAFASTARPMATPQTRGAFYRGWRLMAWDGTVLDLPDTPANARTFGRPGGPQAPGAFPQLRLLALCELGTHAVCGLQIKPIRCQEVTMAPALLRHLQSDMLLIWDRAFLDTELVQGVRDQGAHLLARIKKDQLRRRLQELPDGSYLSRLFPQGANREDESQGVLVRVIEYTHDDPNRPGCGEEHRLMTTVLDPEALPAAEAPLVYHERWEEELAFDEIKTHLNGRPVPLRSKTPAGVVQEVYGLLLAHYVIRWVMHEAAVATDVDPDRLSFINSLRTVQYHLPETPQKTQAQWYSDLVAEVGQQELRPRRERWYPRVVKKVQSRYPKKRPQHQHPPQPTKRFAAAVVLLRPGAATPEQHNVSG